MKLSKIAIVVAASMGLAVLSVPTGSFAYGDGTPDTDPPAEEVVCDGLGGRLWGLCVAYCEAQDCPGSEHPSCEILRLKMLDLSGGEEFPCDGGGGPGPIG